MLQKYHKNSRVRCSGSYLHYTGPTYMPNQRINMAQKEIHSKILPSPTYMEITKNSTITAVVCFNRTNTHELLTRLNVIM